MKTTNATRIPAVLASALWMLALTLMVVATVELGGTGAPALAHWSLLAGMLASLATGWCFLMHERARMETIAEIAADAVIAHQDLRSVTPDLRR